MHAPLYFVESIKNIEKAFLHTPLMQRAGQAAAQWAKELKGENPHPIVILAGLGNNGGDALVCATQLLKWQVPIQVIFTGDPKRMPRDAFAALQKFLAAGGTTQSTLPSKVGNISLIVDGLFGIGINRAPDGLYAHLIQWANNIGAPILALDGPSGFLLNNGKALEPAIRADYTLSFIAGKPGLFTADGVDFCGKVKIATLDIPLSAFAPDGFCVDTTLFSQYLTARAKNSHKGCFGNVGVLGGSRSMVGAAILAARAALHLGAGKVYLGLLDSDAPSFDFCQPELMIRPADLLLHTDLSALVIGPGLGRSNEALRFLEECLNLATPLILDADALNLIALHEKLQKLLKERPPTTTILTPHPAEAARLLAYKVAQVQTDRIHAAKNLSKKFQTPVVLKGAGSVIATPEKREFFINTSGNAGLATAGTGDVLSGFIAALVAQGWPMLEATLAAVHLHGKSAELLESENIGPVGLTAGEIILPARKIFNAWIKENNPR